MCDFKRYRCNDISNAVPISEWMMYAAVNPSQPPPDDCVYISGSSRSARTVFGCRVIVHFRKCHARRNDTTRTQQ